MLASSAMGLILVGALLMIAGYVGNGCESGENAFGWGLMCGAGVVTLGIGVHHYRNARKP